MFDKKYSMILIGVVAFSLIYSVLLPNDVSTTGQIFYNVQKEQYDGFDHFDMDELIKKQDIFLYTKGPKKLVFDSGAKAESFSSYSARDTLADMRNYCENVAKNLGHITGTFWPVFRPLWDANNYFPNPFISEVEMWQAINGGVFYVYEDGIPVVIADGKRDLKSNFLELLPSVNHGYVYCVQTS